ncbi:hypothetical protein [Chamaesiphon minutus]|uniref:Uncharacterized protein n=1 Tax=Chamaesiphon minutus (strain ATCC 27169 / PCC 6605) TaxID=1173020 RepID=K9U9U8_CHAP6|nr:hypothetical protein [Chamaesiphon minutus]AFY91378.1 hypothetical protein Cha6605_0071 [Chamaesiphon minutus PCC 6605]
MNIVLCCCIIGMVSLVLLWTLGETLWWWYLWSKSTRFATTPQFLWQNAVFFLTGISNYASADLAPEQRDFLKELGDRINIDLIVATPFPYDCSTAREFSRCQIWHHLGDRELPLWLISLYNFWQTLLVTILEKPYGNTIARCIGNRLGTAASRDRNLWLICGSIGAGLALAAAPKLREELQVNLIIIAYGGVFKASAGFDTVDRFYHLTGSEDTWAKLGKFIFPGRWFPTGAYARAIRDNRTIEQSTGNHQHLEYLSDRRATISNLSYRTLTLDTITQLSIWQEKGIKY